MDQQITLKVKDRTQLEHGIRKPYQRSDGLGQNRDAQQRPQPGQSGGHRRYHRMGQGFHSIPPKPVHAPDGEDDKYDSAQNTARQGRVCQIHSLHGGNVAAFAVGIQRVVNCQARYGRQRGQENSQPCKTVLEQTGQLQTELPNVHQIASPEIK